MKVKLLILSLLFTISLSAQDFWWWWDSDEDVTYEMEAERYFASLETPLSDSAKTKINNFVAMLKDSLEIDSLAEKFDVMYLFANETPEAGLHNLVKRLHDATAVNSPTFTAWEGFTGNGTSSYLNANYNPSTQGVVYTQNDASMGVYKRNAGNAEELFGGRDGNNLTQLNVGAGGIPGAFGINRNVGVTNPVEVTDTVGLWLVDRTIATQELLYINKTLNKTSSINSTGLPNSSIHIFGYNAAGTPSGYFSGQLAFFFIGSGLTAGEVSVITNCVEAYLDELGVGVIE